MPDELEVKRRMSMLCVITCLTSLKIATNSFFSNSTARQIHLSHTNVDGNPENQLAPPLPITRDIPPGYVPAFQSVRTGLGGDEASTAVKVPRLVPFVEQLKLIPANPTKGLQSVGFCHQAEVESSAQLAVHPRSDRPRLCATEATEATIAETKRSDRATTGPQLKPKLTPVDLTRGSINHSVSFVTSHRPAKSPVPRDAGPIVTGIKRKRLGMGRGGTGYSNKKFKVPAPP
ncbi:uncharacterized protein F5891DRAFT_671849 [Suillus fuscotomentosus]|uniref:Uncharacterized protein n=1 Tax=Suillus fuscotomentosus TaxID=1912939 RepID=A0AAD4HF61_9AGAM|nr:uncharacterized protein F5891DRAFT_671849 [Suillus fuscotomentosus]KAG1895380.1 hypothetical protein F5891DRAFT_671849 [Suillus fuscotomentosus]